MDKKNNGEIRTTTVKHKQKNGDIYVLERTFQYDPEKKYNRVLSTKLLYKIPKGSEEPTPTRHKREENELLNISMMDIINDIGTMSGIDDAVYASTNIATAQKIISIARYFLATNNGSLKDMKSWQYTHVLPYDYCIDEEVYFPLFESIGKDKSIENKFIQIRNCIYKGKKIIYESFDSKLEELNGHGKVFVAYSIKDHQPVGYVNGNKYVNDILSVSDAINQFKKLELNISKFVLSEKLFNEATIYQLISNGYDFIFSVPNKAKLLKNKINFDLISRFKNLSGSNNSIEVDSFGFRHTLESLGVDGDKVSIEKKVYLTTIYNIVKYNLGKEKLQKDLSEIKQLVEDGIGLTNLSKYSREMIDNYFWVEKKDDKIKLIPNEAAINDETRFLGVDAVLSTIKPKDANDTIDKCSERKIIELKLKIDDIALDLNTVNSNVIDGFRFVKFIALCYYEYMCDSLYRIQKVLGLENGDMYHDTEYNLNMEKKLAEWIKNTSVHQQLQWFDDVEKNEVSTRIRKARWTADTYELNKMYLKYLGVLD